MYGLTDELIESQRTLPCGHHKSLLIVSAETGEPLYCDLCDARSARNDAVHDAISRALDEASVNDPTLRGMCLYVGLEKFADVMRSAQP